MLQCCFLSVEHGDKSFPAPTVGVNGVSSVKLSAVPSYPGLYVLLSWLVRIPKTLLYGEMATIKTAWSDLIFASRTSRGRKTSLMIATIYALGIVV